MTQPDSRVGDGSRFRNVVLVPVTHPAPGKTNIRCGGEAKELVQDEDPACSFGMRTWPKCMKDHSEPRDSFARASQGIEQ